MEEDHDGLLGRFAGECVGNSISPELHAHEADRRVRDELGESHQLEVEGAQRIVGVLASLRQGVAYQVGVIV